MSAEESYLCNDESNTRVVPVYKSDKLSPRSELALSETWKTKLESLGTNNSDGAQTELKRRRGARL